MTKPLTKEQAIVVSAYTGILICEFKDMHQDIEKRLGKPVDQFEFLDPQFRPRIKELYKKDFLELMPNEESN